MTVNWNGVLLPCCEYVTWSNADNKFDLGYARYVKNLDNNNLEVPLKKTKSIIETWNGEKIINMRMIHKNKGRSPIPICKGCSKIGVEYKY